MERGARGQGYGPYGAAPFSRLRQRPHHGPARSCQLTGASGDPGERASRDSQAPAPILRGGFTFAISTGIVERNVGADLRGALAPCRATNRPAIIDPQGVAQLLRAIDGYQGSPVTVAALRLAPLVFVRPGELRQAEWSEIDLDAADGPRWSIPAEKMKMRRDHIVPLSNQAVEIITDIHSLTGQGRYLFPCNRTNGRCMSNMALNAALRRMGYEQGEMCVHGFRAMASTLLNELGWNSDLIERQLAHTERNSIRAAYNRAEYLRCAKIFELDLILVCSIFSKLIAEIEQRQEPRSIVSFRRQVFC